MTVARFSDSEGGVVRRPTASDVTAMVELELAAFRDVYDSLPAAHSATIEGSLTERFAWRVEALGQFSLVREDRSGRIDSMLIACPTSVAPADFVGSRIDMTRSDALGAMLDPAGAYRYYVDLASVARGVGRVSLFQETLASAVEVGVRAGYFESRMPGFAAWLAGQRNPSADGAATPIEHLAAAYAGLGGRPGESPDPLLGMYAACGASVLEVVPDAWPIDGASMGFGVLCELPNRLLTDRQVEPGSAEASRLAQTVRGLDPWESLQVMATGDLRVAEALQA